jgi:hypothetical protein
MYDFSDPVTFPSGMKDVVDYVHERGLKFGIYTDRGTIQFFALSLNEIPLLIPFSTSSLFS